MELLAAIDRLIEIVKELDKTQKQTPPSAEGTELPDLDATICAHCTQLQVTMPDYDIGSDPHIFGFTRIPYCADMSEWGYNADADWLHAMRCLRASCVIALKKVIFPGDLTRTQGEIAAFAESNFGEKPEERTIRKWIGNGSLRAHVRGSLWDFSISDLEALVTGHSPQN